MCVCIIIDYIIIHILYMYFIYAVYVYTVVYDTMVCNGMFHEQSAVCMCPETDDLPLIHGHKKIDDSKPLDFGDFGDFEWTMSKFRQKRQKKVLVTYMAEVKLGMQKFLDLEGECLLLPLPWIWKKLVSESIGLMGPNTDTPKIGTRSPGFGRLCKSRSAREIRKSSILEGMNQWFVAVFPIVSVGDFFTLDMYIKMNMSQYGHCRSTRTPKHNYPKTWDLETTRSIISMCGQRRNIYSSM